VRITIFLSLFLIGCSTYYPYGIVLKNTGEHAVDNVILEYDRFYHPFGMVKPGGHNGYHYTKVPVPKEVLIKWVSINDRQEHKRLVKVKQNIPSFFKGDIIFTFNGTNITTSFEEK